MKNTVPFHHAARANTSNSGVIEVDKEGLMAFNDLESRLNAIENKVSELRGYL